LFSKGLTLFSDLTLSFLPNLDPRQYAAGPIYWVGLASRAQLARFSGIRAGWLYAETLKVRHTASTLRDSRAAPQSSRGYTSNPRWMPLISGGKGETTPINGGIPTNSVPAIRFLPFLVYHTLKAVVFRIQGFHYPNVCCRLL
jgi:hypothetical protein